MELCTVLSGGGHFRYRIRVGPQDMVLAYSRGRAASGHVRPPDWSSTMHLFPNDIYTHKRCRRYVAGTAVGTDHVKISMGRVARL